MAKVLKFKKTGWFADEDSARYEAIVNEYFKVRVYKDGYFEKGFRFNFLTLDDFDLDTVTGDFLSTFWSKATKKDAIKRVEEIINDEECITTINNHAKYVSNLMKTNKI